MHTVEACYKMRSGTATVFWILVMSCFVLSRFGESRMPQEEVDALQQLVSTMGATNLELNPDSCEMSTVGPMPPPRASESNIDCVCNSDNNSTCHVVRIVLKRFSLRGVLPPGLVRLPYLRDIDFAYNYLSGGIPLEWGSTQLNSISLLANRLSGEIPKELGNITSLTYLSLEANHFTGTVPSDLGKLANLKSLMLSSNFLTGNLPTTFAALQNLTDLRLNDNNFSGPIPNFIQNWKQLTRFEMHASGLDGPIPSSISLLDKLTELRISDIKGPVQQFPVLSNTTGIVRLVLRNCNISGDVPTYIWDMRNLEMLDLSFNILVGEIPNDIDGRNLKFLFLTGNMLSGNIPESIMKEGSSIDLSYNNFTLQGPEQPACRSNLNLYMNLFRSSSMQSTLKGMVPCTRDFSCPRYGCSLHVNCGGNDLITRGSHGRVTYEGDGDVEGGSARYFRSSNSYWGFSSTGDFMDDDNFQNTRFAALTSTNLSELFTTARLSPLSLTYFHYCLENGNYTVRLDFAEIMFTNDSTYNSLGRRIFDIYIQEKLAWKDFNIEAEASGVQTPLFKQFNASVIDNTLEIRFYWGGKGTTRIPNRGVYGPLISAISVDPNFKICSAGGKKKATVYVGVGVGVGVGALCFMFLLFGILWWRGCLCGRKRKREDFEGLDLQTVLFTLKQIEIATNNFNSTNKIGEGGFGPVYKGVLSDGTLIAVKQLSSKSKQGNREFLNEIGMISCLQHPNLVKLHGCCIEADQLMLVYEYMQNNSLSRALFYGTEESSLVLNWSTRFKICVGIARGLAFLHDESRLKIVHRDIKASNILLDGDLNPKISDFGLARFNEDEKTHISTGIAGTMGYMAPEYALWGYLSYKADVYSFGVVILEIISGKNNNNYIPSNNCVCLLDRACQEQQNGNLDELIDERLGSEVNKEEARTATKVALLCTNTSPSLRPTMSEVVGMLEGRVMVPDAIPEPINGKDLRFKAMRDFHEDKQSHSSTGSQTQNSTTKSSTSNERNENAINLITRTI